MGKKSRAQTHSTPTLPLGVGASAATPVSAAAPSACCFARRPPLFASLLQLHAGIMDPARGSPSPGVATPARAAALLLLRAGGPATTRRRRRRAAPPEDVLSGSLPKRCPHVSVLSGRIPAAARVLECNTPRPASVATATPSASSAPWARRALPPLSRVPRSLGLSTFSSLLLLQGGLECAVSISEFVECTEI
jgi:hypothetical protein